MRKPTSLVCWTATLLLPSFLAFSPTTTRTRFLPTQELPSRSLPLHAEPTRREFLVGSLAIVAAGTTLAPAAGAATTASVTTLPYWQQNPVNKRFGVTVQDAESAGYNVGFITYLTRFLLSFDRDIQQYWIGSTSTSTASKSELFGELAASVEVKLLEYRDASGPSRLLQDLVDRYCPVATDSTPKRTRREIKEARRQLALLFALLQDIQPVQDLTRLLGQVDNASVSRTAIRFYTNNTTAAVWDPESSAIILGPPAVGEARAQAMPVLQVMVSNIRVVDGGSGYAAGETPSILINGVVVDSSVAKAVVKDGKVSNIAMTNKVNDNTTIYKDEVLSVIVTPPSAENGKAATVDAVLRQSVVGITVTDPGAGYVVEKPVKIYVGPSQYANATFEELRKLLDAKKVTLVGEASALSETSSYSSFRKEGDNETLASTGVSASATGPDDGLPALPFWNTKSSSNTFLRLLPAGVGVEYDTNLKRYVLVVDQDTQIANPNIGSRPLGPEFGPRGRAPIERNRKLTSDTLIRFAASGAICASGVHLFLTPLDVVKTKVQTNPECYPTVAASFQTVLKNEGPSTFFSGWLPTLTGNFVGGAALYTLTEVIRRSLSEQAGPLALTYEVPIILAAAATASAVGSVLICPFEAVRIRQQAQPNFAPNAISVFEKILEEEGWISLVNAIPVFLIKNVPYAMTKFTVFDLSTERLFEAFPMATEDLKLSLLISLIGGVLGGTAAAFVSNPADALLSELKKAKSDISPLEAAKAMWERGRFAPFYKGLPIRLVYYPLVASLQFSVYDGVRFALGIGPDDLKLYLDVLGGALSGTGGPV
eukprot:scaffold1485_cov171-Amphora_coffeaeformis.AAC.11